MEALFAFFASFPATVTAMKNCGISEEKLQKFVRETVFVVMESSSMTPQNELTPEEKSMISIDSRGVFMGKISAIKSVRDRTGLGLIESKAIVDKYCFQKFGVS